MKDLDGKVGVCFSGRVHHAGKLSPLMDYLQRHGGLSIRYVTSAFNSYNVDSFERPLKDKGYAYDLIQDWMTADLVEEMNQLNRPVQNEITNRMSAEQYNILDSVSTIWTRDAFRDTIECYLLFREYLKDVNPDIIFILHEGNFWTKIMAYWAQQLGIPIISFQEGMYLPPGSSQYVRNLFGSILTEYSTRVCLWGNYFKQICCNCGVLESKLSVVGAPHLDDYLPVNEDNQQHVRAKVRHELQVNDNQKIILFLLSLSRYWHGDLVRDVRLVGEYVLKQSGVTLIVKWHPLEHGELVKQVKQLLSSTEADMQKLGMKNSSQVIHEHEKDLLELIWSSDLAIIQNSTSGMECLVFGLPLVELNLDPKPIEHSYFTNGVAERIHRIQDIPRLSHFLNGNHLEVSPGAVDRYLEHTLYRLDGNTQSRILDVVSELLA